MKKVRRATTIYLPHYATAKCPIYEHDNGRFYVKCNSRVMSYHTIFVDGVEYSEVRNLPNLNGEEWWYLGSAADVL